LPILLTGDFNAEAGRNQAYQILVDEGGFQDTWQLARKRVGEGLGTFNGFNNVPKNGVRIDWILLQGKAEVYDAQIVDYMPDGKFPSDHFPVVARLKWLER
jgi:endonuclease/exonuclease/phosphatase family metal-dependent hydrolase